MSKGARQLCCFGADVCLRGASLPLMVPTLYHPLYIDNLVDALVLAQESTEGRGRAYLIADEEYYGIETIVRKVADALGVSVSIPHFPVMPLVIAGHVVEKACKPFGLHLY